MQRKIFSRKNRSKKIGLKSVVLVISLAVIGLEVMGVLAERQSRGALPPLFGNFEEIRANLEKAGPKEQFSFAVFGDTEGTSAFDVLSGKLRENPVDFAVHLGDAFDARTYRYFRARLRSDYGQDFPVFFLPGNQDLKAFPLFRFEEIFGPSLFSFIYQDCLFVGLNVQGDQQGTKASLQFFEKVLLEAGEQYRKIFVFMHVPPPIMAGHKFAAPEKIMELCAQHKVDYVFAGHYHGSVHVEKGETTYIVSGAGGKHLEESPYGEFNHGLVMTVGSDYVAKTVVPVSAPYSLKAKLQRFAIVELYPWLVHHRALAVIVNLVILLLVVATFRSFGFRKR